MILPFYFLFSFVPAGLLLMVSHRIRQGQPPEQAARRLFYFLLAAFVIMFIFVMALDPRYQTSSWSISFIPILAALIPIIYKHYHTTPSLHTRQITLTLGSALASAVLLGFYFGQVRRDILISVMVFGGSCLIAGVWWAVQWSRWGRGVTWLSLILLLAGVSLNNFAQNALLISWPEWVQRLLNLTPWLLSILLPTWVGWLLADHALEPFRPNFRRLLAGWGLTGLMFALLLYYVAETSILDAATDGLGTAMISTILSLSAITVVLVLAWRLEQRRLQTVFLYSAVMIAAITLTFSAVTRLDPQTVVVERAAQIDQAVRAYHQSNGYYPTELNHLIPHYILYVPDPVLFHDQSWCYEGGADHYRLGYLYRRYFGMPPESIRVQGSAGTPPAETWVCDDQFAAYQQLSGVHFP